MTAVIAVANQKGGVGKTITAVTLAHGAALKGLRVLLVDLDPQGNVADSMGLGEGNELVGLLDGRYQTRLARERLEVIRSDKNTAVLKNMLAGRDYREFALQEALVQAHGYDLILLDCAPSIDVLHVAALTAAGHLLIPTKLDQLAIKGVRDILQTLAIVQRRGSRCLLAGIVPTFYDRQTLETQQQLENLAANFGKTVWPVVPQDVNIRKANRAGKTLWEFSPTTRAITGIENVGGGYQSVLDTLLSLIR